MSKSIVQLILMIVSHFLCFCEKISVGYRESGGQMKKKTYLADAINIAEMKAQYDTEAKKIVADKGVLSWIVKYTVKEMRDCTLEEIANAIEDIEVAETPVHPGKKKTEAITGMTTEDKVPNEGEVTFDVRFYVITRNAERVKLILNVEIQKDYYPGYDLVTRGVFYCARMLSAQLDTEFAAEDYDNVKKVYSIWLCLNAPKKEADTIIEYRMEPHIIFGTKEGNHRYDLLSVVMIGLDEESCRKKKTPLHGFLGTVFSGEMKPAEKLLRLEKEYGIATTREMKEGVGRMCNLSDGIYERGIERGMERGMKRGIIQGIERGEEQKLIELICKKVRKGKTLDTIATELEENKDDLSPIYEAVLMAAPDYETKKIQEALHGDKF